MKKLLSVLVGLMLAVSAAGGAVTAFADDTTADPTPDFSDNFDSYSTEGFIEDDASFRQNWENELMLNIDGNEMAAADSECKGVAQVIADPTGGAAGNKVLHIKNYDPIGSFFYISPKGLRVQDFEVSFKMYINRSAQEPWVGLSVRKDNNVRYNGCNNVLMTLKTVEDASVTPAREVLPLAMLRGYAGAGNPQDKTKDIDTYDEDNPGNQVSNYDSEGNYNAQKNIMRNWITVRFKVETVDGKTQYSSYVTTADGVENYLGMLEYSSKSVDGYGYVSLNACISDVYIDDFQLTNNDEEPAPVLKAAPQVSIAVSNVTETEADFAVTVDDPDGAMDGLGLDYIEFDNTADENDMVRVTDVTATKVTGLKAGTEYRAVVTYSYDIDDGNGIKIGQASSDPFKTTGQSTTDPGGDNGDDPAPTDPGGGCGSSLAAVGLGTAAGAVILAGAAFVALVVKRKKD